jgi:hypothetical protein
MDNRNPCANLPDVRDGLTHRERIVLRCLHELQQERGAGTCQRVCCMGVWSSMLI